MDQSFGGLLKTLRSEKRMGVRELGRAVGISAMHISNLEKDKSMPSAELVEKLAAELEGDLDQLLNLADQIDPAVVDVIQSNHKWFPVPSQREKSHASRWEKLQKQVMKMAKENEKK